MSADHGQIAAGYREGERVAWLSIWTLAGIGLFELIVALYSNSVGLLADGLDSLADAVISLIIWWGLRLSRRKPDRYFHFGYHKLESLGALLASMGMVILASFIIYRAWGYLVHPHEIRYPLLALGALLLAGLMSLQRALKMNRVAKAYGLISLRTGAYNSIKDASGSFVVFGGVLASALGLAWMDAVAAMVLAAYIYSVSYVAIKESSLILIDAFNAPEVLAQVRELVQAVEGVRGVAEIRLRHLGPYITGRIAVAVDPTMSVAAAQGIVRGVEHVLRQRLGRLRDLAIYAVPLAQPDPGGPAGDE